MKCYGVYISDETIQKAVDAAFKNGFATTENLSYELKKLGVKMDSQHVTNIPWWAANQIIQKMKRNGDVELVHAWVRKEI